eukprot:15690-Eustigmatos_ZCMA.PRE.1
MHPTPHSAFGAQSSTWAAGTLCGVLGGISLLRPQHQETRAALHVFVMTAATILALAMTLIAWLQ